MRIKKFLFIFIILSILAFLSWYFLLSEEEEIEQPEEPDYLTLIENAEIFLPCSINLIQGKIEGNDFLTLCGECFDFCPEISFEIKMEDIFLIKGERAITVLKKEVEKQPIQYFVLVFDSKANHVSTLKLAEGSIIEGINVEEERIEIVKLVLTDKDNLCCPSEEVKKNYIFFGNRLQEKQEIKEWVLMKNIHGLEIEIPKNWQIERLEENLYRISDSKNVFSLFFDIKNKSFFNYEPNPYEQDLNRIKLSLQSNTYNYLPDFRTLKPEEDYLEINLEENKVKLANLEYDILASGDPQGWGGTAAGLYNVLWKRELGFSNISQVYMPYAITFYGKYLIHGEPYFPGGAKLQTTVSGGCIRVVDENMKNIFQVAEKDLPVLVIDKYNDDFEYQSKGFFEFPRTSASSYLVADLDSGFVFAENNINKVLPIASITKMMTAIIATEQMDLTRPITIQDYMLTGHGTTQGIYPGRSVRLIDLLYPLLTESSNNAAKVLSYYLGRDQTIELMNEKTKSIMMENTTFTDPSGYDLKNVSTAKDIFYLARYLNNNRYPLLQISKNEIVPLANPGFFPGLRNRNFFYEEVDFIGGKSGYLIASKYTGFYIFNIEIQGEKRNIVVILLGSESQKNIEEETKAIIEWLKNK